MESLTCSRSFGDGLVVVLNGLEQPHNVYFRSQFLAYLAMQGLFVSLAFLDFPAWEFPVIFHRAVSPLCGEDTALVYDDSCYDFHVRTLRAIQP